MYFFLVCVCMEFIIKISVSTQKKTERSAIFLHSTQLNYNLNLGISYHNN